MTGDVTGIRVKYTKNKCVEVTKTSNTIQICRIPYDILKSGNCDIHIQNRFIVYILLCRNPEGKDIAYVGKSKNGTDDRPLKHEESNVKWDDCFTITDSDQSFLNDGVIQYLEKEIFTILKESQLYTLTTKNVNTDTANPADKESADSMLNLAVKMVDMLGMHIPESEKKVTASDGKNTNLRELNLPPEPMKLMEYVNKGILSVSEDINMRVVPGWKYAAYGINNTHRTLVYCVYNKSKSGFKAYLIGKPELYNDDEVLPAEQGSKYGKCLSTYCFAEIEGADKLIQLCKIGLDSVIKKK